jgi:hypothetical protein
MFWAPPTYEKVICYVCTFVWTCTLLVSDWLGFICMSMSMSMSVTAPKIGAL